MNNEKLLVITSISKTYIIKDLFKKRYKRAVSDVSFSVNRGEIVGILGLNGAGKTTIIKMICGITKPDSGKIEFEGKEIRPFDIDYKKNIGYLGELPYFYPFFTAKQTLEFYGGLSDMDLDDEKIDSVLSTVGILKYKGEKVKNFSKGMMQKLAIATTLIHNPSFLIYDEPTSGLDPIAIRDIRNLLLFLKNEGKTILLSSHSISEVEKICDKVIIIKEGKLSLIIEKEKWLDNNLEDIFVNYAV
jgi:ABC-2 type transport system ATP-binding protein